ncbi:MAG TPA: hypothetical protein ENJ19_00390 [Gammaproteobacteria bacterium]|nr:hypothetical protein [Gammaproteobacteria bacterium]
MFPHPLIRVLSLLVMIVALAWGQPAVIAGASFVVALLLWRSGMEARRAAARLVRRLRWFFLSIVVVFGWFTPGVPALDVPALAAWLPTWEGLAAGGLRIGALALIAAAVAVCLVLTPQAALVGALRDLATPLSWLGLSRDRFAVRIGLTLAAVTALRDSPGIQAEPAAGSPWHRAASVGRVLYARALSKGETAPCEPVVIEILSPPAPWEWAIPLGLALLCGALAQM